MFSLLQADCLQTGVVKWITTQNIPPTAHASHQSVALSVLDQLAAPTCFLEQCLVFPGSMNTEALLAAIQAAVDGAPVFAARAISQEAGTRALVLDSSTAGVAFMLGTAPGLTLQQLLQQAAAQQQQQQPAAAAAPKCQHLPNFPELAEAVFGHLPGSLVPSYVDRPDMALTHVALVTLQQQQSQQPGFVLGLRLSHLIGDWASLRLLLRTIATEYSHRVAAAAPAATPAAASAACGLTSAAEALNSLVRDAARQLPASFTPVRFKLLQPEEEAVFAKLGQLSSSSSSKPKRLVYLASPASIEQLKLQAMQELDQHTAAAAAAGGVGGGGGGAGSSGSSNSLQRMCSTHNVLLARVLQVFGQLPGRQGLPHDVSVAVDMRGRLPQQQQQLGSAVGNFFASAIVEGVVLSSDEGSLGRLAQSIADAAQRGSELWLPDHAWAAQVMQPTAHTTTKKTTPAATDASDLQGSPLFQQDNDDHQPQQQQQVTWTRLHAMGPRALLEQQMQLGLLASLSTTQWPLAAADDACLAGQLPLLAVPGFSQPQPYPLLLQQAAPEGLGGGVLLLLFLDPSEAELFEQAAAAQGL